MLKSIIRSVYQVFPSLYVQRMKRRVLSAPLGLDYPFEAEMKIVHAFIEPGQLFLDVGAHDGFYSSILEDVIGAEQVYSFEPIPSTYARLKRVRPKTRVFPIALSDRIGTQTIRIPLIAGKAVTTRATLESDVQEVGQTGSEEITIQTSTIDAFAEHENLKDVGLIKIDVEGHELHVVRGAVKTLQSFKPVLMIEMEQRHHTQPLKDVIAEVEKLGFAGYYLDVVAWALKPVSSFSVDQFQNLENHRTTQYIQNFLFFEIKQQDTLIARVQAELSRQDRSGKPAKQSPALTS